jgi:hypothetical protein
LGSGLSLRRLVGESGTPEQQEAYIAMEADGSTTNDQRTAYYKQLYNEITIAPMELRALADERFLASIRGSEPKE